MDSLSRKSHILTLKRLIVKARKPDEDLHAVRFAANYIMDSLRGGSGQ